MCCKKKISPFFSPFQSMKHYSINFWLALDIKLDSKTLVDWKKGINKKTNTDKITQGQTKVDGMEGTYSFNFFVSSSTVLLSCFMSLISCNTKTTLVTSMNPMHTQTPTVRSCTTHHMSSRTKLSTHEGKVSTLAQSSHLAKCPSHFSPSSSTEQKIKSTWRPTLIHSSSDLSDLVRNNIYLAS